MRLCLLLAYDGSRYSGWQIQESPSPPPTIQGRVEQALSRLCAGSIRVFGSGRTDAGVHAHGQVAHADVPDRRAGLPWRHALNSLLPPDIRVLLAVPAPTDFHARVDALHKTYCYDFWREPAFVPPRLAPFVWACGPLDPGPMREALVQLTGQHDFASFQNTGTPVRDTVRRVLHASLEPLPAVPLYPPHVPALRLRITATGFLKQMVRNVAGLLAACGRGRLDSSRVPALLAARDRRALPTPTAPPQGLALTRVVYAPGRIPELDALWSGDHGAVPSPPSV
ncbi:tRNA pseudouridine(38-40) synthase TruA [uncultured Desulfovibrio sp.]|uniref:tRNA pseudouridine(38-40) synthase TruA n=1 Tax=uncultured Desulfovibrio sp. TaxID=167968 RepID=UPI00260BF4BB|nr:tRNA pseudouridine(38-40) synthase TruA [uncultured Desulfovibrio sp.]